MRTVSRWLWGSLTCVTLAAVCQCVGVASSHWVSYFKVTRGLWNVCDCNGCVHIDSAASWLQAVRASGVLALLVTVTSICLHCRLLFSQHRLATVVAPVLTVTGGIFCVVCLAVYDSCSANSQRVMFDYDYGYSFWLVMVAAVLCSLSLISFLRQDGPLVTLKDATEGDQQNLINDELAR